MKAAARPQPNQCRTRRQRLKSRSTGADEPIRGERTINTAQSEIISPVFRELAAGISSRAIAARLNDKGIPQLNNPWLATSYWGYCDDSPM